MKLKIYGLIGSVIGAMIILSTIILSHRYEGGRLNNFLHLFGWNCGIINTGDVVMDCNPSFVSGVLILITTACLGLVYGKIQNNKKVI